MTSARRKTSMNGVLLLLLLSVPASTDAGFGEATGLVT